ncbi:MAG: DUF1573 domain-containing protein [Bacteroidales bacterium]|nr:DUF1573 domain-containing protein [Bacteroidales bacterium]
MKRIIVSLSILLFSCVALCAQEETFYKEADVIRFDKKIHDFGDVLIAEGPVSCIFTFTNISEQPIVIHNVISSCGCTTPEWTREPVRPGSTGTIQATYSNDQGPYPFDKTLTVYVGVGRSSLDRPVVLRLRGVPHEQKKDLDELFTNKIGPLGLRKVEVSIGYIDQGVVKSDQMQVANLSRSELQVEAVDVTPGLTVTVTPNPIPARSMARLNYSVNPSQMEKESWGKQRYRASFRLGGKAWPDKLTVTGVIKENFDGLTRSQIEQAPVPVVDRSYHEFGEVKKGASFTASYTIRNKGKNPLIIRQVEGQAGATAVQTQLPLTVKPGGKADIKVKFDTSRLDFTGEVIEVLTVITNAPSKPILNLFITGNVK